MSLGPVVLAALALGLLGQDALAEELAETLGAWTVTCHQTEAGGRQCELRNDEDGRPALEQRALLSFTLHDGRNEAEGLIRIAELELPPRLEVEVAFGVEAVTIEGVGRRGRLAARFAMPKHELPELAAAALPTPSRSLLTTSSYGRHGDRDLPLQCRAAGASARPDSGADPDRVSRQRGRLPRAGERARPVVHDAVAMMLFLSAKGWQHRSAFERTPVYVGDDPW